MLYWQDLPECLYHKPHCEICAEQERRAKLKTYSSVRVYINGVELTETTMDPAPSHPIQFSFGV